MKGDMRTIVHEVLPTPAKGVRGREWRSDIKLLGLPLIHIAFGRDGQNRLLKARGIIAIGQYASGIFCISQFGLGIVCISQFSIAGVSVGQFAIAGFAIAQFGIFLDGIAQCGLRLLSFL